MCYCPNSTGGGEPIYFPPSYLPYPPYWNWEIRVENRDIIETLKKILEKLEHIERRGLKNGCENRCESN